jgi:hypothetical protein
MPESRGEERRRYVRVSADFMVRLRCEGSVITYPAAFARNISSGGIGIEIGGRYPDSFDILTKTSEPVGLEITLDGGEVLAVMAQVMWGHVEGGAQGAPAEGQRFRVGLQFLDLDEHAQRTLDEFVKMKVNEALTEHMRAKTLRKTPPPGRITP